MTLEGMTPGLAYQLADRGICTMDDLAELSVDELTETEGVDQAAAAALIMKAHVNRGSPRLLTRQLMKVANRSKFCQIQL